MKKRYAMGLLISVLAIVLQWSCKNNNIVGTSTPSFAEIDGIVYGSSYSSAVSPLEGAKVYLTHGNTVDSTTTDSSGIFRFGLEIPDTSTGVDVTLRISLAGYNTYSNTFKVKTSPSPFAITLTLNSADFAVLTGAVIDSATRYPLASATVTVSLPGGTASATTLLNGYYSLSVNLYSLNSLKTTVTVTKDGFKTFRFDTVLTKGRTIVDTIALSVDRGSTIAHIAGLVTDNRTGQPIPGVTVVLASSLGSDSVKTLGDGSYRFDPNLNGQPSVPMTLTFRQSGYNTSTVNLTLTPGESLSEDVVLTSNWNYAIITGTVRDSATSIPLSGAKVIVSLTGATGSSSKFMASLKSRTHSVSSIILDSTTTFVDGSFSLAINLVDLDSVSATLTVSEPGYKLFQFIRTFVKGANDIGNVFIRIDDGLTTAHLLGYVTDSQSRLPLSGVSVYLTTPIKTDSATTSYGGFYSFDMNLQGLTSVAGTLLFRLNSYNDTSISFSVNAGQTLTRNAVLSAKPVVVTDTAIIGVAKTFKLISVERREISITGASTGASKEESSTIVWQVLDSLGNPVGNSHQYKVTFSLTESPNGLGGATIFPDTATTDGSGKVYATIVSGTTAGVIQVVARLTLANGRVVQASPVPITVDAGLPDQAHFELNSNPPHSLNFAGYPDDWSEIQQGFTAQVGDRYSNPVAAGTALYFNTTSGIVTGAAQTDAFGHADATLSSGLPLPFIAPTILSPYSGLAQNYFGTGDGYAFVKAWTLGDNGVTIADSDLICISAKAVYPIIELLSPTDTVHSGGSLLYHIHVCDRFGNPLESGTRITASVIVPPPPPGGGGDVWSILPAGLGTAASATTTTLSDHLVRDIYSYPGRRETGSTDFEITVSATLTQGTASITSFNLVIDIQGRNTDNNIYETSISGVAIAP
jgi:hypothetical protein